MALNIKKCFKTVTKAIFGSLNGKPCLTERALFYLHYHGTPVAMIIFSLMILVGLTFGYERNCNVDYIMVYAATSPPPIVDEMTTDAKTRAYPNTPIATWLTLLLLAVQALLLRIPRRAWLKFDDGTTDDVLEGINAIPSEAEVLDSRVRHWEFACVFIANKEKYNWHVTIYRICELFATALVAAVIYCLNVILNGEFVPLLKNMAENMRTKKRFDPLFPISFPRVSNGDSSTNSNSHDHQSHCHLPLNQVSELIFLLIYIWYAILICCTILVLIRDTASYVWTEFRVWRFVCSLELSNRFFVWKRNERNAFIKAAGTLSYGQWFLLFRLKSKIEIATLKSFLHEINSEMSVGSLHLNVPQNALTLG